ncbi:McrC family protein [Mucilaginibacter sp. 3215]|uniref:McrC family protein n=1 Tax=Mucilaginibacter sp. 3215 TaxID=3373912 RepID=UPI003D2534DE
MNSKHKTLTVSEHMVIRIDDVVDGMRFDHDMLHALQKFHGEKGVPYYTLGHRSVRFCEYVGVLQIGQLTIEVLPKPNPKDKNGPWRKALLGMLQVVSTFPVDSPTSSQLKIRPNSILDHYFELFVNELDQMIRKGLIKKYRSDEGNCRALKGSLLISKDIQHNLTRRDRFYTKHTVYDGEHPIHQVLWAALELTDKISTHPGLKSRIATIRLAFPEQKAIRVTEQTFTRLILNRNNAHYNKALEIAKLLLLKHHPDISQGHEQVLALMFDMNDLWEKFVLATLRKKLTFPEIRVRITDQSTKHFWKPQNGYSSTIRPDIVISYLKGDKEHFVVLDTKWKNLNGYNPSSEDLRQLFVYHSYFHADRVALVYPGKSNIANGKYYDPVKGMSDKTCAVIRIEANDNITQWQEAITSQIGNWLLS